MNRQQAEEFHKLHPEIFRQFEEIVFEALHGGVRRWSAAAIWQIMRWQSLKDRTGPNEWSLNNDLHPYYARMFVDEHPALADFFAFRASQYDQDAPDPTPQIDLFEIFTPPR